MNYVEKCVIGGTSNIMGGPVGISFGCVNAIINDIDTKITNDENIQTIIKGVNQDVKRELNSSTNQIKNSTDQIKNSTNQIHKSIDQTRGEINEVNNKINDLKYTITHDISQTHNKLSTSIVALKSDINISNNANNINTKKIYQYLINNRISSTDIKNIFNDSKILHSLNQHLVNLESYQTQNEEIKTKEQNLVALDKIKTTFTTLGKLGQKINSPVLITISQTGSIVSQIGIINQTISTMMTQPFTAMSLFEPITLMATLTIGLIGLFSKPKSQSNGIVQMMNALVSHINRHMESMHEHLSIIHDEIRHVGQMINYAIHNQEKIYKLQYETYKLINQTFNILNNKLDTLSSQTSEDLENIHTDIKYIIATDEIKEIKDFKLNVLTNVNMIKKFQKSNKSDQLCIEKMICLESMLSILSMDDWNGYAIYDGIKTSSRQCCEYILRNTKKSDYCLSMLADKYEKFTNTCLIENYVDKKTLVSNTLWSDLVLQIFGVILPEIILTQESNQKTIPKSKSNSALEPIHIIDENIHMKTNSIIDYDCTEMFDIIRGQIDNITKFLTTIKDNHQTLFDAIIENHRKLINNLDLAMFCSYRIEIDKRNNSDNNDVHYEKSLHDIFGKTMNSLIWPLDENYLIGKLFENLIGANNLKLTKSFDIMNKNYTIKQNQPATSYICYAGDTNNIRSRLSRNGLVPDLWIDPIGGLDCGDIICYMMISENATDIKIHNYDVNDNKFDSFDHKDIKLYRNSISVPSCYNESSPMLNVDRNQVTDTIPQAWTSILKCNVYSRNYIILRSPNGQIAKLDISLSEWKTIYDAKLCLQIPCKRGTRGLRKNTKRFETTMNTCLDVVIGSTMFIHIFDWTSHLDRNEIEMRCELYDIHDTKMIDRKEFTWRHPTNLSFDSTMITSPNQFFVQVIRNTEFNPYFSGDYVIGVLGCEKEEDGKIVETKNDTNNDDDIFSMHDEMNHKEKLYVDMFYRRALENKWNKHCIYTDIKIKQINQTKSTMIKNNGKNQLIIVSSVIISPKSLSRNDMNNDYELLFIVFDLGTDVDEYNWTEYFVVRHKLVNPNKVPDLQALKINVIKIGTKKYVLSSVLTDDFGIQLCLFDPETKQTMHLNDGPKINLDKFKYHMQEMRTFPGFYPVKSYEMNTKIVNEIITLFFAYTCIKNGNRVLEVVPYNLGPSFKNDVKNEMIIPINISNNLMLTLSNVELMMNTCILNSGRSFNTFDALNTFNTLNTLNVLSNDLNSKISDHETPKRKIINYTSEDNERPERLERKIINYRSEDNERPERKIIDYLSKDNKTDNETDDKTINEMKIKTCVSMMKKWLSRFLVNENNINTDISENIKCIDQIIENIDSELKKNKSSIDYSSLKNNLNLLNAMFKTYIEGYNIGCNIDEIIKEIN
jgi:hypothetical protein